MEDTSIFFPPQIAVQALVLLQGVPDEHTLTQFRTSKPQANRDNLAIFNTNRNICHFKCIPHPSFSLDHKQVWIESCDYRDYHFSKSYSFLN